MENLLFLGVPILKHIKVRPGSACTFVQTNETFAVKDVLFYAIVDY